MIDQQGYQPNSEGASLDHPPTGLSSARRVDIERDAVVSSKPSPTFFLRAGMYAIAWLIAILLPIGALGGVSLNTMLSMGFTGLISAVLFVGLKRDE